MGWLRELGFDLESSESWQEFLIWSGWTCFNDPENVSTNIRFILLPTTRSGALYIAFGYLIKEASVHGSSLFMLSEVDLNTHVYFRFSQLAANSKVTTSIYSGIVTSDKTFPFEKKVVVKKRLKGKSELKCAAIWSSRRRFSLQPLHKLNTSTITLFLESLGYTDTSDSYLSRTSVVDILSSNKKELMHDMDEIKLTAKHPDTKKNTNCWIDELLAHKSATHQVTNIRGGSRLEIGDYYKFEHIILDGAKSFLNNDPLGLDVPSITVLLGQKEFASPDVQERLKSLLEKRDLEDECDIAQQLPSGLEIPFGIDILSFHLRRDKRG